MIFGFFVKVADYSCIHCMVILIDPVRSLLREYSHISFSRLKCPFMSFLIEQSALSILHGPL